MRSAILSCLLMAIAFSGCKKETATIIATSNVTYIFNTNGQSSDISIHNFKTGQIQDFINQTGILTINDNIAKGDRVILEMKGIADGLDASYYIHISINNKVIGAMRALGAAGKRNQDILFDHTFSDTDFQ